MVLASDDPVLRDPSSLAVLDSKALFDNVRNEQVCGDDHRTQLEVAVIKDTLDTLCTRPRWTPHTNNPVDGLTKLKGAHMEPLLSMLKTHTWQLRPEAEILCEMRQERSVLGYTPRPKRGALECSEDISDGED